MATSDLRLRSFERALRVAGFRGDLEMGLGARQVASTDNSIYEVLPDAIVYPRNHDDLNRVVHAAQAEGARGLSLTARGGNTGTNGQSLNGGVIIDFARHMNRILELDTEHLTVSVEPGVVLSQLNAALSQYGLFFPPTVSTSSRATLGGMVGTDASGKGSRHYGKTSDYIEALDVVLADGTDWRCETMARADAETIAAGDGLVAAIHRETLRVVTDRAEIIAAVFPKMNRGLTGYNLQKTFDQKQDRFSLAYLLAGSEGTLAITKRIKLRVCRKPSHRALVVIRYDDFAAALADVERLLEANPLSVEILDDKVLGVATTDVIWSDIESVLGEAGSRAVKALNFVEFVGFSESDVSAGLARLASVLEYSPAAMIDSTLVHQPTTIAQLWTLREKSVGLLAKLGGGRQGMPFVEDTAVPPERLGAYVADFRDVLDRRGLQYGMFGHADVGCLHVRPFLDMKDPAQAALVRPLSDEVAALAKRHGGLLWGEHGRGFRGEYSPFFFGPELYAELTRLKSVFDPDDRLNPGKLASPAGERAIDRIDAVPLRGEQDRRITSELISEFDRAVACNGNGACFSWDALDAMCPSYKATRDRAQSPKGRAALLRAWARLESAAPEDGDGNREALEDATRGSLATCLSCKACTTLCPVQVDIPTMRSRFLGRYYERHGRPFRHHLMAKAESLLAIGSMFPGAANLVVALPLMRLIVRRLTGFVNFPEFSHTQERELPIARAEHLAALSDADRDRSVVLVEDSFTRAFDRRVERAACEVLQRLGYRLYRLPVRHNGKILHLLGMRRAFAEIARERVTEASQIAVTGVRLVGLDAATSLMFEQEYREFQPDTQVVVIGLEKLLADEIAASRIQPTDQLADSRNFSLLGHCTEGALRPQALGQWAKVLNWFGISATPIRTGCCGMAGMFGHEQDNLPISERLFELSWRDAVKGDPFAILATGYSCREQTARLANFRPRHPIELLSAQLLQRTSA